MMMGTDIARDEYPAAAIDDLLCLNASTGTFPGLFDNRARYHDISILRNSERRLRLHDGDVSDQDICHTTPPRFQ